MNREHNSTLLLFALCSLFIISCSETDSGTGKYQRFDWDLHGTWTTNDPGSLYTGMYLKIGK
jgi:hypothetical protein